MARIESKTNRKWIPRFSLRTLLIVFTAMPILYIGSWKVTKHFGLDDVNDYEFRSTPAFFAMRTVRPYTPCPFVIVTSFATRHATTFVSTRYYFWFGDAFLIHWSNENLDDGT